jgi:PAP2 superfamily
MVVIRLGALAVLGVSLFFVVYVLAIRTASGQTLGDAALAGRRVVLERGTRGAERILEPVGTMFIAAGIITLMAIAIIRRRPRLALATALMVGVSLLVSELLKGAIIARPDLVKTLAYYKRNSFPSGHATAAIAIAAGLVMVTPRRLRGAAGVLGAIGAALVAYSTLANGWHRPSDVAGSATLVLAAAAAASAVLVWWRGGGAPAEGSSEMGRPLAAITLLSAGIALVLAGLLGLAGPAEALSTGRALTQPLQDASFTAMSTAGIGVIFLSLGLLVLGLHRVQLDSPASRRVRGEATQG